MKKTLLMFFALLCISLPAFSQIQQQQQQQFPIIKPTLTYGQIQFALNLMSRIELMGSEVDAFIEIKGVMLPVLVKAEKEQKKLNEKTTLELNVKQADNVIAFMSRGKLQGIEADVYKEFKDALFIAAQSLRK
jgi:hypothetical protein